MIDYDPHKWRDHLLDIKGSMVRQIGYRVLFCVAWSVLIAYVHERHFKVDVSERAHMLVGVALGLLLVFRTNASYDRFWEARKQWGAIINETRNLGRSASVFMAEAPDLLRKLLDWTVVFPHATMHMLRGERGLGPSAERLPADEVQATLKADHLPVAVGRRMSEQIAEARRRGLFSDYVQVALDQNVQLLVDYMGACERIHRTALPFAYMVHLRRAIIIYCFTLPFALVATFHWLTIPATLFVAYMLYGIEEIGVEIEDPFGADDNDLPLERFCATIENNLSSILDTPASTGTAPRSGENA